MTKSELRKIYLNKRKALSKDEVFVLSEKIIENFINYFKPMKSQKLHVFIAIEKFNEIRTELLVEYCLKNKIRVFVPKVLDELISVEIDPATIFETNSWGISEPISNKDSGITDFDFIITPLLYCDQNGNRVGYGKGFYDGFFESVNSETLKIGVNFFPPEEIIEDLWEKDIALDYLVTPTEVLSFS